MGTEDVKVTANEHVQVQGRITFLQTKVEGCGFNSHPGQSFSLSLCGFISISRATAHMVHMGYKPSTSQCYTLISQVCSNISATRPTFAKT